MTKISIIIPTFNRQENLRNTLDSLLAQETDSKFDWELIVIDNNSQDKTKELIERYEPRFSGRLKYLFEMRQGKSYALNLGIKEAQGPIISFTDDDCTVNGKWLRNINDIFSTHNIDLLGGRVIPYFVTNVPKWLKEYRNTPLKYPLMFFDLGEAYIESTKKNKFFPIGANVSFRKESFRKFGEFTESGRAEDINLCNNWLTQGAEIAYSPDVIVYHYSHPSRLTKKYFRKYFFQTGRDHIRIFPEQYLKGKYFLGIPRWILIELLRTTASFLRKSALFKQNRFIEEVAIWQKIGMISEIKKIKLRFENLR